jgi:hypothetical protein
MAINVCFECTFLNVSSVSDECCKCFYLDVTYTYMLQAYVSSVFRCFIRIFASVSSECCICLQLFSNVFQVFLQVFHLSFFFMCTTVASVCFKNRSGIIHEMRVESGRRRG